MELLKIFLEVGCPHSDNGRKFTAAVIQELTSLWPTCKIINGRPRHPASQGSEKLVTEEDLDLLLKQQDHEIILTPEDLPADSLENNNDASTSKDLPASELIDYNASTSNDLSVSNSTSTPVVLPASEGEAAVNNNKACCAVCGMESTRAHSCDISKNPVHAICGNTVGEEGYGSNILCYLCLKEESIKDQRENAAKHLIRSAEKMKEDWLPRNALQIATTTFTETVPRTNLSLREIAGKL
ncbi:hypothetical protein QE152_g8036 [Popillia japonica]|uniref:SCAN domain-containing protein n=1 Tax=Popillia japonica TaxID=7064 RepID=A0AAW1MD51_POPJA